MRLIAVLFLFPILLWSCTPKTEPQVIYYGQDYCDHCKMKISDSRYGGEVVTDTGKAYKYDAIECLHAHVKVNHIPVAKTYVVDYDTGVLVDADKLFFVTSEKNRGPMGTTIMASLKKEKLTDQVKDSSLVTDWKSIQSQLKD